jgi:hypothetical protein
VLAYELEYVGTARCPVTPSQACAVIVFRAPAKTVKFGNDEVTYGISGRMHFDSAQGRIDESRFAFELAIEKSQLTGNVVMTPR